MVRRRIGLGLVASIVAIGSLVAPAVAPAARAGLDQGADPQWVVLDITAHNTKPNVTSGGIVTKYFYDGARLAIQRAAKNVHATQNGAALTTTVSPAGSYAVLEFHFRSSVFYRQTAKVHVRNILANLRVSDRAAVVAVAVRRGIFHF